MSKIKCFNCHDFGHYASQCPQKKRKGKQHASTTDVDDDDEHLPKRRQRNLNLMREVRRNISLSPLLQALLQIVVIFGWWTVVLLGT
jgi:hypothetical protein